jgi:ribosomal protein S18 acetylase RimI-like enzyme
MAMEHVFREFDWRRDKDPVIAFQKDMYELNFPGFRVTAPFLEAFGRELREADRRSDEALFVFEKNGEVCGFLWLSLIETMTDPCVGFIKNIYVAPSERGKGLGRLLLEKADEWFLDRGVRKAQLTASTVNQLAIQLYEKVGYETIRVRMEKSYW